MKLEDEVEEEARNHACFKTVPREKYNEKIISVQNAGKRDVLYIPNMS